MKFNSNGTFDNDFGNKGIALHNSSTVSLEDFELTNEGKIIAIGNIGTNSMGTSGDFIVTRFNSDGSLDKSFGENNGFTRTSFDVYTEYVNNVKILPDNKIYISGSFWDKNTSGLITRFDENGILDVNFGKKGAFSSFSKINTGLSVTPDMKLVLTGLNSTFHVERIKLDIPFNASTYNEVKLVSNPENGGTVVGGGYYNDGDLVSVRVYEKPGSIFNNWIENGNIVSTQTLYNFNISENKELKANFTIKPFQINTSSNIQVGGVTNGGGEYYYGEKVTLTAIPNTDYKFSNWTLGGKIISYDTTYNMIAESDVDLVANFTRKTYQISANAPYYAGKVSGTGEYYLGETVTLKATSYYGFIFDNWSENGNVISTNPELSFVVESNRNFDAYFKSIYYEIKTISNPPEGGVTTGDGVFPYDERIPLVAKSNPNYKFIKWTIKNDALISYYPSTNVYVTGNETYIANFQKTNFLISAEVNPSDKGYVLGEGNYDLGSKIILEAKLFSNLDYEFDYWTENGNLVSINPILNITVNSDRNLVANFREIKYNVRVTSYPKLGGSVYGEGTYDKNFEVTIKAVPDFGYRFVNWTEAGEVISQNMNYTFNITKNRYFIANFESNLSLDDISTNVLDVSPNPFDKFIQIKSKNKLIKKIELYDISGELIKQINIENKTDYRFNTTELKQGMYLLKVFFDYSSKTYKIVKNKND